jgi:exosortase/archaeosortase family protein
VQRALNLSGSSRLPRPRGRRRAPWSQGRHGAGHRLPGLMVRVQGRHSASRRSPGPVVRVTAIGVLAGVALVLIVLQYQVRRLEADATAHLYNLVTPTAAESNSPVIWFGPKTPDGFGLMITPDCSSALLIAPLAGLGMVLIRPHHPPVRRAANALAAASAVMVAGNLIRVGAIALVIRVDGIGAGYQVGQLVLGSLISVVCIGLSLALLTVILRADT